MKILTCHKDYTVASFGALYPLAKGLVKDKNSFAIPEKHIIEAQEKSFLKPT